MLKVKKKILILTAGLVWFSAGMMLIFLSLKWLPLLDFFTAVFLLIAGSIIGFAKSKLIFNRFSDKNIARIEAFPNSKVCFFAFLNWKSYLMIGLMSGGGSALRKAELIPKPVLLPIYFGIGLALLISSFSYFRFLQQGKVYSEDSI